MIIKIGLKVKIEINRFKHVNRSYSLSSLIMGQSIKWFCRASFNYHQWRYVILSNLKLQNPTNDLNLHQPFTVLASSHATFVTTVNRITTIYDPITSINTFLALSSLTQLLLPCTTPANINWNLYASHPPRRELKSLPIGQIYLWPIDPNLAILS